MRIDEYRKLTGKRERKPRRDVEHEIQSLYFEILKLNEQKYPFLRFIFAVPNATGVGGDHGAILGKRFNDEGRKRGAPDICVPFARHGRSGLWLETKHETDLSTEQQAFKAHLESENYLFRECRSVDAELNETEWYLEIKLIR